MINIGKILKRSWYILWNYRILWIFGILLALTTGGGNSGNSGSSSRSSQNDPNGFQGGIPENAPQWMHDLNNWFMTKRAADVHPPGAVHQHLCDDRHCSFPDRPGLQSP